MTQHKWGHYTELHPDTLANILTATPIAVLPWGAIEWHGAHLPLGMDGIAAQYVAEHVVQRTGGVLLPMTWWPMTTLPHRFSLAVKTATFVAMVNDMLDSLAGAGFHTVILISGHYAQGHEIELMKIALAMYEKSGLQVLTLPPAAISREASATSPRAAAEISARSNSRSWAWAGMARASSRAGRRSCIL